MKYNKEIVLRNGRRCVIRNAVVSDAGAIMENFVATHGETDNLLSYPDEFSLTPDQEEKFLLSREESDNEVLMVATVDGNVIGTAGIDSIGRRFKVKHRVSFGISLLKEFWGLGIGRALTEACIECAVAAGYEQMELEVITENENAVSLYRKLGFKEFGRNPLGLKSRYTGYQELFYMRLELR